MNKNYKIYQISGSLAARMITVRLRFLIYCGVFIEDVTKALDSYAK